ncbi:MAG: sugar ABC transporter permease [bacterium]
MNYFVLILPFIVLWFMFNIFSVLMSIYLLVKDGNFFEIASRVLLDSLFWVSLKNSFIYVLVVIPLQFFSFLIAFGIYHLTSFWAGLFRSLFYLPVVIPIASIGFVFKIMFNDEGVINDYLSLFLGFRLPFMSDYFFAMLVAFLVTFWKGLGYYVVIYLSGLYSISREIVENSVIDGMSFVQRLWFVYLPLLKGTFYFCFFLSVLAALKVFAEIFIVTEGGPGTSTYTLMMYVYGRAFYSFDMQGAIFASFVLSLICIFVSLFIFRDQLVRIRF